MRGVLTAVAFALLLGAGTAWAHTGTSTHVHFVDQNDADASCSACPDAPTGWADQGAGAGTITLHWTAPTGKEITGYLVRWKKTSDSKFNTEYPLGPDDSTHTIAGLEKGVSYDVSVRADGNRGQFGSATPAGDTARANGITTRSTDLPSQGPIFRREGSAVNGNTLTVIFHENLDTTSKPPGTYFSVRMYSLAGGSRRTNGTSAEVSISGATVTVALESAALPGDDVEVQFSQLETKPIQDTSGNNAPVFAFRSVTNNTRDPDAEQPPDGGGGRGGGGGGDRHGNSAATATPIAFGSASPRAGSITGQINTRSDVDYFRLRLAQPGVLLIETNGGRTDTRGTVWQAGEELAAAADGGPGANFRLATPVAAGDVVIAVAGEGGATGAYTLRARLVAGYLENPSPTSFQSGLGLISGWVCEADGVTVEIEREDGTVVELAAAYGTARADTATICGDSDNGFGVLFNWNLLDDGDHAVVVLVDDIELGRAAVTVTTLGAEFIKGLQGSFLVEDFPRTGEQVRVVWQESQQNFVLAPAELGAALTPAPSSGGIEGVLENPTPASYQSGIGVISGWVCEAEAVVIEIDGQPIAAAAGTERSDTLDRCGDVDNGFGLLVNWAEFGAGAHEVVALVDGVELSRATVTVTVVDETEPYMRGLTKRVELPRFPTPDETVTLVWQEAQQNFVITGAR